MAEYARIDADGTYWLNLKKRGWVRLEGLLDEFERDHKDVRLALGLATVGVLWSLLAIGLIAWMLS